MPAVITTNIDIGHFLWRGEEVQDGLLTFGGAATYLAGTILARDTTTQKYVPYVIGGSTAGNGTPRVILWHDVTAAGAGDQPVRVAISGTVNKNRLIVAADGNASNITKLIEDSLRAYGIVCLDVAQLSP